MSFREKTIVRKFYEDFINKARFDGLDEILSQQVVWHDPLLPKGEVRGIDSFRGVLEMFRLAFPDLRIIIEDQIQENDKVVTRFAITGTHLGDLMGIPPTRRKFRTTGISIIRFDHGKVVEEWIEEDGLGLLRQVGVVK